MRGHKLTPTCVVLSPDDTTAFSGSKDNSILRWDVETGKRVTMLPHWRKLPGGKVPAVKAHSKEVSAESRVEMLFVQGVCIVMFCHIYRYIFSSFFRTNLFLRARVREKLRAATREGRSVTLSRLYAVRYVFYVQWTTCVPLLRCCCCCCCWSRLTIVLVLFLVAYCCSIAAVAPCFLCWQVSGNSQRKMMWSRGIYSIPHLT